MNFEDSIESLQRELKYGGYKSIHDPFDISDLLKEESVIDCEIIARKDQYNILYMQVQSNWRGIATNVAQKNKTSCLVITKYKDQYFILSTLKDAHIQHPIPRHIVIDIKSKTHSIKDFVKLIKTEQTDTIVEIDEKIHTAFDEFSKYKEAFDEFAENLEKIIHKTKIMIQKAISGNKKYAIEANKFLKICQEVINEKMELKDIEDMLIQHILTYRIFAMVYDDQDFHHTNTVAKSLEKLKNMLNLPADKIDYYTIELVAESIIDVDQRQEFLKKIYETFYHKYDPAKAEKDGIVYTPSEVVNFMVKSTDELLKKHFNKNLSDEDVTILDPAAGTGTFPVHILRHIDAAKLEEKYTKSIYANEISILPYYIATLNIENTFNELSGKYKEFENICWMDTLDSGVKDYSKLTSYLEGSNNVDILFKLGSENIDALF